MNSNNIIYGFNNQEIRLIMRGNEPWFVAKDICDILGFRDAFNISRLLNDKYHIPHKVRDSSGKYQNMTIISEPGLYK